MRPPSPPLRRALVLAGLLAVAACAAAIPPLPVFAAGGTASALVVALRPEAGLPRDATPAGGLPERLAALGALRSERLGDALARSGAARPASALDPSRVWRVSFADSGAARRALAALAADPGVSWVEPVRARPNALWRLGATAPAAGGDGAAGGFPDDPLYRDGRQWGLDNRGREVRPDAVAGADVRAAGAWRRTTGSNRVRLALADTGIDLAHPDLAAVLPDGSPRLAFPADLSDEPAPTMADSFGHGTPVAGVMAALTGNGAQFDSLGVAGVCGGDGGADLGCRLIPIKVTPGRRGSATSWSLARAILYAAEHGARAVNLSFAGSGPSRLERLAMLEALARGCVVVAAIGNRGARPGEGGLAMYPAAYAGDGLGIAVGASDPADRRAAFSSHGPGLDLLAPGVDVWTTFMTYPSAAGASYPGFLAVSGTSFAAPFVTGAVGLLAAARPALRDRDFQVVLRESARDLGDPGPDELTGWGRLDLERALAAVDPALGLWHGEVAAARWSAIARDTLAIAEEPGEARPATLYRVSARVALPDSFAAGYRVWTRVTGTGTVRAGFRLPYLAPWSEVLARDAHGFVVGGYLYRLEDASPGEAWRPLAPGEARFAFTVLGPVRRTRPAPPAARSLALSPNPFTTSVRLAGPPGARLVVTDLAGRVMVRARIPAGGSLEWDGRDGRGREAPPGLYLVTLATGTRTERGRLLRLR